MPEPNEFSNISYEAAHAARVAAGENNAAHYQAMQASRDADRARTETPRPSRTAECSKRLGEPLLLPRRPGS
jgi:hypothetical protein